MSNDLITSKDIHVVFNGKETGFLESINTKDCYISAILTEENIIRLKDMAGGCGELKVVVGDYTQVFHKVLAKEVVIFNNKLDLEFSTDKMIGQVFLSFEKIK
jgi:hypothetical protein